MNPAIGIIIGAAVIFAGVVGVLYVLRAMKGKITIQLDQTSCNPGEEFTGSCSIEVHKPLDSQRVTVCLIGKETVDSFGNDDRRNSRTREIFRAEREVAPAQEYRAGETVDYPFSVPAPGGAAGNIISAIRGVGTAFDVISGTSRRQKWYIEVRMHLKGLDLVATKAVSVSM